MFLDLVDWLYKLTTAAVAMRGHPQDIPLIVQRIREWRGENIIQEESNVGGIDWRGMDIHLDDSGASLQIPKISDQIKAGRWRWSVESISK